MTEREFVQKLKEIGFVPDKEMRSTFIREGLLVFVISTKAMIADTGRHWEDFETILSDLGVPSQLETDLQRATARAEKAERERDEARAMIDAYRRAQATIDRVKKLSGELLRRAKQQGPEGYVPCSLAAAEIDRALAGEEVDND